MSERRIDHPVLGSVLWDGDISTWYAKVEFPPGNSLTLGIVADGDWEKAEPETLFQAGIDYLEKAEKLAPAVLAKIGDDLHSTYNESWADEDPDEGTPPMELDEFLANLRLSSIDVQYDGSASWYYEAGELFAGHLIWLMVEADGSFIGGASLMG